MTAVPSFSNADPVARTSDAREKARAAGRRRKAAAAVVEATTVEPPKPVVRRGRERDLLDGKAEYKLVPVDDLHPDPENPRKTFRDIAVLAANMKELGLLQPVTARIGPDDKLIILWGERRWRAAKSLSKDPDPAVAATWAHIPTIIRYGVLDSGILARQLVENSHRDNMDPIDEARAIRRYMHDERISTYMQCAQKIGHSLSWVANRVALLDLDGEDQERVSSGELGILNGVAKSRLKTGNMRRSSVTGTVRQAPHFSEDHFLAGRARSRCAAALKAGNNHGSKIGGVACGSCWEVVIRQDARRNSNVLAGGD